MCALFSFSLSSFTSFVISCNVKRSTFHDLFFNSQTILNFVAHWHSEKLAYERVDPEIAWILFHQVYFHVNIKFILLNFDSTLRHFSFSLYLSLSRSRSLPFLAFDRASERASERFCILLNDLWSTSGYSLVFLNSKWHQGQAQQACFRPEIRQWKNMRWFFFLFLNPRFLASWWHPLCAFNHFKTQKKKIMQVLLERIKKGASLPTKSSLSRRFFSLTLPRSLDSSSFCLPKLLRNKISIILHTLALFYFSGAGTWGIHQTTLKEKCGFLDDEPKSNGNVCARAYDHRTRIHAIVKCVLPRPSS